MGLGCKVVPKRGGSLPTGQTLTAGARAVVNSCQSWMHILRFAIGGLHISVLDRNRLSGPSGAPGGPPRPLLGAPHEGAKASCPCDVAQRSRRALCHCPPASGDAGTSSGPAAGAEPALHRLAESHGSPPRSLSGVRHDEYREVWDAVGGRRGSLQIFCAHAAAFFPTCVVRPTLLEPSADL